mmetsp:Transcript_22567/g.59946  ORF Transcript_22567/g.59946 Transcript_22567/m.59946 type:complete len:224 (-) Transcript_22567:116-787(-)
MRGVQAASLSPAPFRPTSEPPSCRARRSPRINMSRTPRCTAAAALGVPGNMSCKFPAPGNLHGPGVSLLLLATVAGGRSPSGLPRGEYLTMRRCARVLLLKSPPPVTPSPQVETAATRRTAAPRPSRRRRRPPSRRTRLSTGTRRRRGGRGDGGGGGIRAMHRGAGVGGGGRGARVVLRRRRGGSVRARGSGVLGGRDVDDCFEGADGDVRERVDGFSALRSR